MSSPKHFSYQTIQRSHRVPRNETQNAASVSLCKSPVLVGLLCFVLGVGVAYWHTQEEGISDAVIFKKKVDKDAPPVEPSDRIIEFITLWERGQCDKLKELVTSGFEYRINLHHEPGYPKHGKGRKSYQYVRIDDVVDTMCDSWENKWRTLFLRPHNLGDSFGSVSIFGADLHERPDGTPCLSAYHGSYSVQLNKNGKMKTLIELVDQSEYHYYMDKCGAYAGAARRNLGLDIRSNLDIVAKKKDVGTFPETTLAHKAVNLLRHMWAKECDLVASKIPFDPNFVYSGGHLESPLSQAELLEHCEADSPQVMGHSSIVSDANTVMVSGPAVATKDTDGTPCIFFYEKAVTFTFSSEDANAASLVSIDELVDADYYKDCQLVNKDSDEVEGEDEVF